MTLKCTKCQEYELLNNALMPIYHIAAIHGQRYNGPYMKFCPMCGSELVDIDKVSEELSKLSSTCHRCGGRGYTSRAKLCCIGGNMEFIETDIERCESCRHVCERI